MFKFNAKVARFLMACGFMVGACAPAVGQKAPSSDVKDVYAAIDCSQWTLNPDGTWNGGPNARVGSLTFPNTMNHTMKGYVDSGVDAEATLLKKCGKR